jgi:tetratricopeptide (TPR) repeat protein
MLSVAAEIVDQVSIVKTEQAVSLFAKFYLTASDINATLKDDRHAYESAKEARVLVEPFYVDDPNNPKLLKLFYDSVWRMGDAIAGENFDAATQKRALKEYIEAERLARRLSVLDPENDDRKSALAFVLLKIGDVWQAMDDWESAITAYSSALEVLQKAIDKTPENPDLQRNHANALSRVGQALAGKGNRDAATKHFGAALEIRSKLAAADRSNDVLQSNLATSHREIAKLHEKYGERDQALAEYDLAIRIRENLLSRDGSNDTWRSYLASLYTEKGNILESKRNLDVALGQYQMAHKLRLELALRDPANSGLQYNLATAGMSIADLLVKQNGDLDEAVRLYQGAIMVLDDFLPSFPRYDEDVFWCHIKIGDILRARDDSEGALTEYGISTSIAQTAATNDAADLRWQQNLSRSYAVTAELLNAKGRKPEVLEHYKNALIFAEAISTTGKANAGWTEIARSLRSKFDELKLVP